MIQSDYREWKFMNLYVTDIGSTLSEKHGVTSVLLTEGGLSPRHGKDKAAQRTEVSHRTRTPQIRLQGARREVRGFCPGADLEGDDGEMTQTRTQKRSARKMRVKERSNVNPQGFESEINEINPLTRKMGKRQTRQTQAKFIREEEDVDRQATDTEETSCTTKRYVVQDQDEETMYTETQWRSRIRTSDKSCNTSSEWLTSESGGLLNTPESVLAVKLKSSYKERSDLLEEVMSEEETEQDPFPGKRKKGSKRTSKKTGQLDPDVYLENDDSKKDSNRKNDAKMTLRKGKNQGTKRSKTSGVRKTRVKTTHTCSFCEKVLACKAALDRHLLSHSGARPFHCDECGKNYRSKMTLKVHQQNHTGKMDFICNDCGKQFTHMTYLRRHIYSHNNKELRPHHCLDCGKHFIQKSHLDRHKLIHSGMKPFVCQHCGAAFNRPEGLRQHLLEHAPVGQGGRPAHKHQCLVCRKTFATFKFLQDHIKSHTGQRPHSCPHCSRAFSQRWRHDEHVRSHAQEGAPSPAGPALERPPEQAP
ncbi:zinc finger protein 2-like [Osmerus eperlanus]|uniref:zinc finger protein 2-like n=1 Tax=Osmerus eperlanus TaxID=29151 RepID=UPI002E14C5C4